MPINYAEQDAGKTPEELRAEADRHLQAREDSWNRSDTDGFLSQWASGLAAQRASRAAAIAENDGLAEFPALFRLDGTWVPARVIDGRYGRSWMILDEDGKATGEFLTYRPKRRTTNARKGYTEGTVLRPAVAAYGGRGRGLSGSAWVETRPTDRPTDPPVRIVTTDRFADDE
jgi:hypothetical protein